MTVICIENKICPGCPLNHEGIYEVIEEATMYNYTWYRLREFPGYVFPAYLFAEYESIMPTLRVRHSNAHIEAIDYEMIYN